MDQDAAVPTSSRIPLLYAFVPKSNEATRLYRVRI